MGDLKGVLVNNRTKNSVFEQFFCKNAFLGNRAPAVGVGKHKVCPLCRNAGRGDIQLDEEHIILGCVPLADCRKDLGLDVIVSRFDSNGATPVKSIMCRMFSFFNTKDKKDKEQFGEKLGTLREVFYTRVQDLRPRRH